MLSSSVVFHFAILCIVDPNHGLEETYRGMVPTDTYRDIVNQIFSSLKLRTSSNSKIQEYAAVHKYLVSRARLHRHEWKEELNLTSLDIDGGATYFTTIINDVLKEEKEIGQINYMRQKEDVDKFIEHFYSTLAKLRDILFFRNQSRSDVYDEVSQLFPEAGCRQTNDTEQELDSAEDSAGDIQVWVPGDTRRIFQGTKSSVRQFPFMASIHILNQFSCAGSIINDDLVITAASGLQLAYNNRFYRENPAFLAVRVGSSFYNGAGDLIPAMEVYFHPSYDPKSLYNNLAIIRLRKNILFHKKIKKVRRIDIDPNPWALPLNTDGITIIGWGAKDFTNKMYPTKSKMAMDVLDVYPLKDCQDIYSKAYVTDKHFCAGFVSRGGGACNRDVGAPGVVHGVLAGVASFGSASCGAADAPTVFTKLGFYTDWIEGILEEEHPVHRLTLKPLRTRRYPPHHTILSTRDSRDNPFSLFPINDGKSIGRIHKGKVKHYTVSVKNQKKKFLPVLNSKEFADYKMKNKDKEIQYKETISKIRNEKNSKEKTNEAKLSIEEINNEKISKEIMYEEKLREGKINKVESQEFPDLTRARIQPRLATNDSVYARADLQSFTSDAGNSYEDGKSSGERMVESVPNYTGSNIESDNVVDEPPLKTRSDQSLEQQIDNLFENAMAKKAVSNKKKKKTKPKHRQNKENEGSSEEVNRNSNVKEASSKSETYEVSGDATRSEELGLNFNFN